MICNGIDFAVYISFFRQKMHWDIIQCLFELKLHVQCGVINFIRQDFFAEILGQYTYSICTWSGCFLELERVRFRIMH